MGLPMTDLAPIPVVDVREGGPVRHAVDGTPIPPGRDEKDLVRPGAGRDAQAKGDNGQRNCVSHVPSFNRSSFEFDSQW